MVFSGCLLGIGGSLKVLWNGIGSLKTEMERRWLVAKMMCLTGFTGWKDVGKPPTFHRLSVLHGFQAASVFSSQRQPEKQNRLIFRQAIFY